MGVSEMTVKRTRLCYWIARPAKPGVQSSNTSRVRFPVISHTPCVLAFITHILCINGIEMTPVWLIWYTLRNILFKFAICFIALMNLGETWHLKRRGLETVWQTMLVAVLLPSWLHAAASWRHTVWIRIATSHNAWMGYEYSLQKLESPKGDSQT